MISDLNRSLSLEYALGTRQPKHRLSFGGQANLPERIIHPGGHIRNYYTPAGRKTGKKVFDASNNLLSQELYYGDLVIKDSRATRILHADGVVNLSGGPPEFDYHIKDHLGNVRLVIKPDASNNPVVLQSNDYYPFGMSYSTAPGVNKYLYNSKEEQEMPGKFLDYGWRMYDAQLGRWHGVDAMAEFYYGQSPYNYVANDPINFVDPDGNFRTRFGAWLYKLRHGGDGIGRDSGGEYYVYTNEVTHEDGVDVFTHTVVFDWKGRNEGKDLKLEAQKEAWITQHNFQQSMESMGIEVTFTHDINEARSSMLQIPSMVVLPNVIKATSLVTNTTKSGINNVDGLLKAAGKLKRTSTGAKQGFVNGNAEEIFKAIVKGGTNVRGNLYKLNDGTLVNFHKSTRTGVKTIDINKAGQAFKIRIQ